MQLYLLENATDPCGTWTMMTGDIAILPYLLDPGIVATISNLTAFLEAAATALDWNGTKGLSVNLWNQDWAKVAGDVVDPAGYMANMYLDFMQEMSSFLLEAAQSNQNLWRAFFQVQDFHYKRDENGELALEENGNWIVEKVGKPRWIEVTNLNGYVGGQGNVAGGYLENEDAYTAAIRGRNFFYCNEMGGAIPDHWNNQQGINIGDIYGKKSWAVVLPEFGL